MRRDQHRLREFLQRKASQDAPGSPSANSTPTISLASTSQDAKTPEMVKMDKPANENVSGNRNLEQAKTDEATSEVKDNEIQIMNIAATLKSINKMLNKNETPDTAKDCTCDEDQCNDDDNIDAPKFGPNSKNNHVLKNNRLQCLKLSIFRRWNDQVTLPDTF